MAETDISGNFRNYSSRFLEWLRDGDVDEEGVKLASSNERPFNLDFERKTPYSESRIWTNSTDRARMTQNKPDYFVAAPGNSLFTDLARLRAENRLLRSKLKSNEGKDAHIVEQRREIERRKMELDERERKMRRNPKTIYEALSQRRQK